MKAVAYLRLLTLLVLIHDLCWASSGLFGDYGGLSAVDLAVKASQSGGMILAAKGDNCAALVSLSKGGMTSVTSTVRNTSSLKRLDETITVERIKVLDSSIIFASVGLASDSNYLADSLFDEVTNHRFLYGTSIPVSRLAKHLSMMKHSQTLESTSRPFGVHSCLIGRMRAAAKSRMEEVGEKESDVDNGGPWIYEIDVLGNIFGCRWCCVGNREDAIKVEKELRKRGLEMAKCRDGKELVQHCLECLQVGLKTTIESYQVSASILDSAGNAVLFNQHHK